MPKLTIDDFDNEEEYIDYLEIRNVFEDMEKQRIIPKNNLADDKNNELRSNHEST